MATNLLGGVSNMGWDRPKPKKRTYKSSDYEYRPRTFGSSFSFEKDIQELQYKIDDLTNSSIYDSIDPFLYGEHGFESISPSLIELKEKVQLLSKTVVNQKQEDQKLRMARKDPAGFARLFPEKYVEYLMDDKLTEQQSTVANMTCDMVVTTGNNNVVISNRNMATKSQTIIGNNNIQIGGNVNLGHLTIGTEDSLRAENARLKAELSTTERQLAVLVKPPTWRTLLKEWFMYKVLKRPKPQPLYIGPYR